MWTFLGDSSHFVVSGEHGNGSPELSKKPKERLEGMGRVKIQRAEQTKPRKKFEELEVRRVPKGKECNAMIRHVV
jgi:hypothetical protein